MRRSPCRGRLDFSYLFSALSPKATFPSLVSDHIPIVQSTIKFFSSVLERITRCFAYTFLRKFNSELNLRETPRNGCAKTLLDKRKRRVTLYPGLAVIIERRRLKFSRLIKQKKTKKTNTINQSIFCNVFLGDRTSAQWRFDSLTRLESLQKKLNQNFKRVSIKGWWRYTPPQLSPGWSQLKFARVSFVK